MTGGLSRPVIRSDANEQKIKGGTTLSRSHWKGARFNFFIFNHEESAESKQTEPNLKKCYFSFQEGTCDY